jgi:regulator of protease activity HflC (stomatin/prohibitin superfamily)
MNPITAFLVAACLVVGLVVGYRVNPYLAFVFFGAAVIVALSLKMANVWQKFVILRMGKLQSVKGAGLFAIIPILDTVIAVIDGRIQTTAFNSPKTQSRSTSMRSFSGTCTTRKKQHWRSPTSARRLTGSHRLRCAR